MTYMEESVELPRKISRTEITIGILLAAVVGFVIWTQYEDVMAQHRDSSRKVAINAIRANLEEVIYPQHSAYPETLTPNMFSATDVALLTDQHGVFINKTGSEYRYEPSSCSGGLCQHYVLSTVLEKEAPFVQTNQR